MEMSEKVEKVIKLIDLELKRYGSNESPISNARNFRLKKIKEYLISKGFPKSDDDKLELALHPFYFQEALYDGLDIFSINGDSGHLTIPYEIDLAVQTGGCFREDVSEEIFDSYTSSRTNSIDYWRNKKVAKRERFIGKIIKYLKRITNRSN